MQKYDLELIIGFECNNNCLFCSNQSLRDLCRKRGISTISFEQVKNILESNNNKEVSTLFFVGGEPTIIKDFFKIIRFAKKEGYPNISIQTNGRMFKNMGFSRKIYKEGIDVGFSIHGDSALLHDKLTRSPGSFEQLVSGMNNLKSFGQTFTTNTTINKINYKRIPQIISFLSRYDPSTILFSLVSPVGIPKENLKDTLTPLNNLRSIIKKSTLTAKKLNQNIKFIDVPLCIMDEYEDYMHEKDFEFDRKIVVKGMKDSFYLKNKNKKEKTKLPICSNCKRNKDCFGIWKGYTRSYGTGTIRPIINEKIELWNNVLDEMPMKAVSEGIKHCAKLELVKVKDTPKVTNKIKKIGLKFDVPQRQFTLDKINMKFSLSKEYNENNYVLIFVSKKKEILNEFIKKTNEEVNSKNEKQRRYAIQRIGRLLGYPKCCTKTFSELNVYVDDKTTNIKIKNRTRGKFNWLLNNLISPYTLIDFYPCSYNCKNAINYAQNMLNLVSRSNPNKKKMIRQYLNNVILYFNFNNYIIFDGSLDNNVINYLSFKSSKDFSKEFMQIKDPQFLQLVELLKKGNKAIFDSANLINTIKIFKDSKLIKEMRNLDKNKLLENGYIFDFKL